MKRMFPTGSDMQPNDFSIAAMETPEGAFATLGGSIADSMNLSAGLGTMLREAQTPDLAKSVVVAGRGGAQWRDDNSQEVAARGDVLFNTDAEFKASPYYRENIPFESGMTASRAKAIAEQSDLSKVRQYFGSKRPVLNVVGSIIGAGLDPVNYIPIMGEYAGAYAASKIGRVAGRALVGGADAGLNALSFQVLTAPQRAKLGDDTSWGTMLQNSAFAAMAGVVFGGAHGAVSSYRASKIERVAAKSNYVPPILPEVSRLETQAMRSKSAIVMNDALFGMINDGEVKLGERSQGHIADMEAAAAKPFMEPSPIQFREISTDTALTAMGGNVPVRYAVVEARDLVASQRDGGGVNPQYPAELQPRNRERVVSQHQIQSIAKNLDPRLLDKSPKASDGAPIIASSGVVESGNGRVLAIRQAYAANAGAGERYKNHLAAQGYPVGGMQNPVLVRIRDGQMNPTQRQAFTRAANERDTLAMSGTERAMADASAMSDNVLSTYRGGDVDGAANRDFVKNFLRDIVSENDRGGLITADGAMTQEATRRIEAALLAKAYQDTNLVSALIESTDINIRSIGGAMLDVAPSWAQMRAEVQSGAISPDVDLTPNLLEATRLVQHARREDKPLALLVGQKDIFSGKVVDPKSEAFLRLMFRDTTNWKSPVGRERLAKSIQFYIDEARKTSPTVDLLGESAASPADILSLAKRKQQDGATTQDGFQFNAQQNSGDGLTTSSGSGNGPDLQSGQAGGSGETRSIPRNYTVAPPEPQHPELKAAYAALDVAPKPVEANAIEDAAIKQAKAEGFDPILNTNDHELDMQSLRHQGLLTPEDEAALKAADETHDTVGAWEDVMNAARECFLS
jgi:ddrB-like ParB superfamily domain